jgi:pimeloyl-ACP methyl ester carboxylesterase
MSVPYSGRNPVRPTDGWRERMGDNFFYILYFQEPGVAEAEFDADPESILWQAYGRAEDASGEPAIADARRSAGGWIGRAARPDRLPPWLSQEEFDYYVAEFTRAGFRGGINFYRNFDRNWETTPQLEGQQVTQPALFIAGENDGVIRMFGSDMLTRMREVVPNIHDLVFVPDTGHWVQQERPAEVNTALLEWLATLT